MIRIIIISLSLCFGIIAADPLPPLEQLPTLPDGYVAPPSPFELAAINSNRVAMATARRRQRAAMIALAAQVGAPTGTTYEAVLARAEALEGVQDAVNNDVPLAAGVSTTTGVIGALAGYLIARKKISG